MVLATAVAVPGGARPAQAVDPATVGVVIQFAAAAFSFYQSSQSGGMTLEEATTRITQAVENSRDAILAHADQLAVAEASACARHHVLEFADIEEFPLGLKQRWAQDVTGCVTLIDALWGSVGQSSYEAKQQLGIALGAVGPIALIARAQAGFSTGELTSLLVSAFDRVRLSFTPYCYGIPNVPEEFWLSHVDPVWVPGWLVCQSYPGEPSSASRYDDALYLGGGLIRYDHWQVIIDQASRTSAHGVAVAALAVLRP
jgi:hypothetical protein